MHRTVGGSARGGTEQKRAHSHEVQPSPCADCHHAQPYNVGLLECVCHLRSINS